MANIIKHKNWGVLFLLLACALAAYFSLGVGVYYWKEYLHHFEAGALSDLFALHAMQENYMRDHGSYADSFDKLGVPLGATLNGDILKWDGPYRYRMIKTVRSQHGVIQEYSIDARPATYSRGNKRSFLMDQTGFIHYTDDNREAASSDKTIPPGN